MNVVISSLTIVVVKVLMVVSRGFQTSPVVAQGSYSSWLLEVAIRGRYSAWSVGVVARGNYVLCYFGPAIFVWNLKRSNT